MPGPPVRGRRRSGPAWGRKRAAGIFGIDAAFDGVAALDQLLLRPGQPLAGGDPKLRLYQVDAGDHFGDGVLDLQPRVHLEEIETGAIALAFEQELDGSRIAVAGGAGCGHGGRAHAGAQAGVSAGEGLSSMIF